MNARASYQSHNGLEFNKNKRTEKRLKFFERSTGMTTIKPLDTSTIYAIARGVPSSKPMDVLIRLVQGETLSVSWVNGDKPNKTYQVSLF